MSLSKIIFLTDLYMKKLVIISALIVSLLAIPVVSFASPGEIELSRPVNLSAHYPQLKHKEVLAIAQPNNWAGIYILTKDVHGATQLYNYRDGIISEVEVGFPKNYPGASYAMKDLGSHEDNLTITADRYNRSGEFIQSHLFFANWDISYLWNLPTPDDWVIDDVFYGKQSLMFVVRHVGTEGIFIYNYFWPDEVFQVASFGDYDSFDMAATHFFFDHWLIQACKKNGRCDLYVYRAGSPLQLTSGVPGDVLRLNSDKYYWIIEYKTDGSSAIGEFKIKNGQLTPEYRPIDYSPFYNENTWNGVVYRGGLYNILNTQLHVLSGTDSDGDLLGDYLEDAMGTDINNSDTDGDGHSDFEEIVSGFNPNGPCQMKEYGGQIFRYGRGYVPAETHSCYDEVFVNRMKADLGENWEAAYGVDTDKYETALFGYIYGDYPLEHVVDYIRGTNDISTSLTYHEFIRS